MYRRLSGDDEERRNAVLRDQVKVEEDDLGKEKKESERGTSWCSLKNTRAAVTLFAAWQLVTTAIIIYLLVDRGSHSSTSYHVVGSRVPRNFFFIHGSGSSNVSIETGSFDAALFNATIADANIMKYTSVLPVQSKIVPREEVSLEHGAVLEAIMAQADGRMYDTITAGIRTCRVRRKSDNTELGGYVVEYPSSDAGVPGTPPSGINVTKEDAETNLHEAMSDLLARRYGPNYRDSYIIHDEMVEVYTETITNRYGSIIVALGVADYTIPNAPTTTLTPDQPTDYREKYGMFAKERRGALL